MNMKFSYIAYNTSLVLKDIGKKLTPTNVQMYKCENGTFCSNKTISLIRLQTIHFDRKSFSTGGHNSVHTYLKIRINKHVYQSSK